MAEFIETQDEFEAVEQQQAEQPEQVSTAPELPEKLRGKTAAELAKIITDQEQFIGKQAREVGEVRSLADQLIKRQFDAEQASKKTAEPELDDSDFLLNPKEAIDKAVANHPSVKQAQEAAFRMNMMQRRNALLEKHPDVGDIVQDSEFQEWVKASPVRTKKFMQAHQQFDLEAGDDLLSTYKELREARKIQKEAGESLRADSDQSLRAASVPVGNAAVEGSKKIYRRADLIKLQLTDPRRYMALQDEIMQAYAEKRVR